MFRSRALACTVGAFALIALPLAASGSTQRSSAQRGAPTSRPSPERIPAAPQFALQVALDRAGFSPGEIDGRSGTITRRALAAFQKEHGLPPTGDPDSATWSALGVTPGQSDQAVTHYQITADDEKGPFTETIPEDMMEKAKMPSLGYTSPVEALGERFHVAPALLKALNPQAKFTAGESIVVPNVSETPAPVTKQAKKAPARGGRQSSPQGAVGTAGADPGVTVSVSKGAEALTVRDAGGTVIMFAPVTVGSEHDPLPIGQWRVTGVFVHPTFNYNPDLFWDANPSHTKAKLPAGPNNPVGDVWIDLDREHYGIHGTPEPGKIGYRQSHGCVRLTNWDARKLASVVAVGTPVIFEP